jgi:tetratricopeptide (TPR) repeat protein
MPGTPHPRWGRIHRFGHLGLIAAVALAAATVAACSGSSSSALPKVPVSTRFAAGLAALREHNYSAAEGLLSQVTRLEPRNYAAYYDLGLAYQDQGVNRAALVAYAKAQALDERFVPVIYNRAVLYSKADPQLALFLYRRVISLQRDSPTAFLNLGLLEAVQGPHLRKQAERDLAMAVQLDPSLASRIPAPLRAGVAKAARSLPKSPATPSPQPS